MISRPALALLLAGSTILAACGDSAAEQEAERTEDAIEAQAAADAAEAAPEEEILGMTEAQLLEADLVDADGNELGDIALVERNAMRTVTGLLVELEGDRYVTLRLRDVSPRPDGDEVDVQTTLSSGQLAKLPDADIDPTSDTMTGAGSM
ncbi:MAG: hypothetical protein CL808_07540 [Citromicrobium sp.]|nr:hypothetical protein [Citromicrobium sp.]